MNGKKRIDEKYVPHINKLVQQYITNNCKSACMFLLLLEDNCIANIKIKVVMEEDGCKGQPATKITIKDGKKPAEIYRTDLITAMKVPDHQVISSGSYFNLTDPWKQEWERGVQVPVNMDSLPEPSFRPAESGLHYPPDFKMPNKLVNCQSKKEKEPQKHVPYDLDDEDVEWLRSLNRSRKNKGLEAVDELLMEKALTNLENQCYTNMGETISTSKGLSIEYDEDIVCDVCRVPECEDGNEILFCDVCDVAVHQACYGVQKVPVGSWVCKPCTQLLSNRPCVLCSTRGGAMKRTRLRGALCWVHMSCALWIPEVGIGDVEKMEPITKIETIPAGRWNLLCYLCKEKKGACIQCSVKTCVTAFHVTCGFNSNLEMQTVWDESAPDGVRHVCYCYKHGSRKDARSPQKSATGISHSLRKVSRRSPATTPSKSSTPKTKHQKEQDENVRQKKLRGMEEEFYNFVDVKVLASELDINVDLAKTFYRFWTLKRKAKDDASLLPPTAEQQERLTGRQIKPYQRASMEIERVVRLRQDLERIRNLCYMVERREKQKRELTKAREAVFRKELEIVEDSSGKMTSDDSQWARFCCTNNFTEYETLQKFDLDYRRKQPLHTKHTKRYRRRGRPRKRPNILRSSTEEESLNCSSGSKSKTPCEVEEKIAQSGDTNWSEDRDSTASSIDEFEERLVTKSKLRKKAKVIISSSEPMSSGDLNPKEVLSTETCGASSVRASKHLEDMSSDSDFEDESTRKAKRRASIRQRLFLKSPKQGQPKNGIIQCSDSASSPPGKSTTKLNGIHIDLPRNGCLGLVQVNRLDAVLRSPSIVINKRLKKNRKRLFGELSRKVGDSDSQKLPERVLRSNRTVSGGVMILDKFDITVSPKRLCHRNGITLSSSNDENIVQNREKNDRLSGDDTKINAEVSSRTRSHSNRPSSRSPVTSSAGIIDSLQRSDRVSKVKYKQFDALNGSLAEKSRTRRSPGKLSDSSLTTSNSSFPNSTNCSKIFGRFRATAVTSA